MQMPVHDDELNENRGGAMFFAMHLYRKGLVSADQVLEAVARQNESRVPIGRLAVQTKKMTIKQVAKVLAEQADRRELFGKLAVDMGFISEDDLARLLMVQNDQLKPLHEILVDMGAIDRAAVDDEYRQVCRPAFDDEAEQAPVVSV